MLLVKFRNYKDLIIFSDVMKSELEKDNDTEIIYIYLESLGYAKEIYNKYNDIK